METTGISSQALNQSQILSTDKADTFRSNFQALIDAIKNGDLDAAKKAYANIQDSSPDKAKANSNSPFAQLISQLGDALGKDDLSAAKQALSTFEANRPSGPPPSGGPSDAERSAFGSLVEALKQDNLDAAKKAYAQLLQARDDKQTKSKSPIDSFLDQIGSALDSGNLDSAKAALNDLAQHRPSGGAVDEQV